MNADLWSQVLLHSQVDDLPNFRFINRDCNKILNDSYYWRSRLNFDKLPIIITYNDFLGWFNEYHHVRRTVEITTRAMTDATALKSYWEFDLTDLQTISLLFVDGVDQLRLSRVFMRSRGVWDSYYDTRIELCLTFDGGSVEMKYKDRLTIKDGSSTSWQTRISYATKLTQSAAKQMIFNLCYRRTKTSLGAWRF